MNTNNDIEQHETNNIEEYKILREEMLQSYQSITNYNTALYTASSVIFAFALPQKEFYYSLIPLSLILPLFILCESERQKICWIGAYLNVFHEGKNKAFNWERRHHTFDSRKEFTLLNNSTPYFFLTTVSCGASVLKILLSENTNILFISIPLIAFLLCIAVIKKGEVHFVQLRKKYIEHWETIKSREKPQKQ